MQAGRVPIIRLNQRTTLEEPTRILEEAPLAALFFFRRACVVAPAHR
jgi:hypothetical protein